MARWSASCCWRDIDSGPLQIIVDDHAKDGSRVRHGHECLAHQILRTDGFEGCETVVTRQNHHQGLLDEKTVRQLWHTSFPPKKRGIDFSFRKAVREQWRVLTRYHHVDIRQFVAQDPQGFGHPLQFVSGQKSYGEAWLAGMSDPASSFGLPLQPAIAPSGRDRERFDPRTSARSRERGASAVGRLVRSQDHESADSSEGCDVCSLCSAATVRLPASATATK